MLENFPVFCKYVNDASLISVPVDEKWVASHCRISRYFLQIVKCSDIACCGELHTNWSSVLPNCFFLAPLPCRFSSVGPSVPCASDIKTYDWLAKLWKIIALSTLVPGKQTRNLPCDTFCPSVAGTVQMCTCVEWDIYHPSIAAKQQHQSFCQKIRLKDTDSDSTDDEENASDIVIEEEAPMFKRSEILAECAFDEVA